MTPPNKFLALANEHGWDAHVEDLDVDGCTEAVLAVAAREVDGVTLAVATAFGLVEDTGRWQTLESEGGRVTVLDDATDQQWWWSKAREWTSLLSASQDEIIARLPGFHDDRPLRTVLHDVGEFLS